MNKAARVCLFSRLVRSLLVYSTQDDIYSIYRRYVGCQYPGAAVERPPSASAHHASPCCGAELEATLQRQEALPLSMRLGKCSRCVGKPKRMQRKALHVRIPARWGEKENKNRWWTKINVGHHKHARPRLFPSSHSASQSQYHKPNITFTGYLHTDTTLLLNKPFLIIII